MICTFISDYCIAEAYINFDTGIATMSKLPNPGLSNSINSGYSFYKGFAVEGGYNSIISPQFGTATVYSNLFDAAAKGTIPLSSVFQMYGRLGLGVGVNGWTGTATDNCTLCTNNNSTFEFGLLSGGLNFSLNKSFDLRLEDVIYVPMIANTTTGLINSLNFGFQYNF